MPTLPLFLPRRSRAPRLFVLSGVVAAALLATPLQAQHLALPLALGQLTPLLRASSAQAQYALRDWAAGPAGLPGGSEPLSWALWPAGAKGGPGPAETVLALRPEGPGFDVVLRLRHPKQLHLLQHELELAEVTPQPVTCVQCKGQRYQTPTYTVTFYSGKPQPYPYVVVLHALPPAAVPGSSTVGDAPGATTSQ